MSTRVRLIPLVCLAATGLALQGCKVSTDLGAPCLMVKADPLSDGGTQVVDVTESDITPGKDFISFGATDCENFVCVLDADHIKLTGNPDAPVYGYCSQACAVGNTSDCKPQQNPDWDKSTDTQMSCRALLLDPATISRICQADQAKCQQYFDGNTSPYFCARGGTGADAGS